MDEPEELITIEIIDEDECMGSACENECMNTIENDVEYIENEVTTCGSINHQDLNEVKLLHKY